MKKKQQILNLEGMFGIFALQITWRIDNQNTFERSLVDYLAFRGGNHYVKHLILLPCIVDDKDGVIIQKMIWHVILYISWASVYFVTEDHTLTLYIFLTLTIIINVHWTVVHDVHNGSIRYSLYVFQSEMIESRTVPVQMWIRLYLW